MPSNDSSRGPNLALWLLGLLAVGGAALLGLPRVVELPQPARAPAPESSREDTKAEAPLPEPDISGPLTVLHDHLRVQPGPSADLSSSRLQYTERNNGKARSLTIDSREARRAPAGSLEEALRTSPCCYEFLIATVPDPVESRFAHEFDAVLGGIQRAYEARGFVLRASWMPWRHGRARAGRAAGSEKARKHREYPGCLLFQKGLSTRSQPRSATRALVCLVGENPISGIHKPAMTRALTARQELGDAINRAKAGVAWAGDHQHTVRLVAPMFSGSQSSLILALKAWKAGKKVQIINGSATALQPGPFHDAGLNIQSTVIPHELVTQGVLAYLAGSRDPRLTTRKLHERVAILREVNTVYGKRTSEYPKGPNEIDLPFPLSISQLQVEQDRTARAPLPSTEFIEPKLPVRDLTHLDAVPPYDPASAATVSGQGLRAILTTIERARVSYVGIVATDSRDVVFLNRLLRKQCPDVRVFTTEPSVALLHPEEAYHLRGMVVGSTYPLAPITQSWARGPTGPRRIFPFPTQASQGYYNAILAHAGELDQMLGYQPPRLGQGEDGFGRPPIWICVVGQGGRFVPVHCYTQVEEDPSLFTTCSAGPGPRPRFSVPLGILLGSLAAVGLLTAVLLALSVPWFWANVAAGLTPAEVEVDHLGTTAWVWAWRGVMLAGALLLALPFTLPARELFPDACCAVPRGTAQWRHWFVAVAAALVLVQITAIVGLLLLRSRNVPARWLARHHGEEHKWRGWLDGHAALAALAVAATVFTWAWWGSNGPEQRFFLYVRATDLTAGLSPLVPMMLLGTAALVLGWFSLHQADQARRTGTPPDSVTGRSWLWCPFAKPWSRLVSADDDVLAHSRAPLVCVAGPRALAATLGLGVPFLLWFLWNAVITALPSGEGVVWDWMMRLLFGVVGAATVLTLVRFLALWSRLEQLLGELLRVPMVGAFDRLPHEITRLFGGYLYSNRPRHHQLAIAAWALPPGSRQELADQIAVERPSLAWVFGGPLPPAPPDSETALRRDREDRQWLTRRLWERAQQVLAELPAGWGTQTIDEAFGGAVGSPPASPPSGAAAPSVREKEDYVAAFVVLYLGAYFAQLRMLVYAMTCAAALLLLAAASYTFQPPRPQLNPLVGLLAAVAVGTVYVLYRINKNGLVSRIMRTTPDRFTPDLGFFSSLTTYVLPVVVLLLLQVFGLFRFILEPVVALFR